MQSPRSAHSLHSGNKSVKSVNAIAMPNCPMSDIIDMSNNRVNDELILWSVLMVGLGLLSRDKRCLDDGQPVLLPLSSPSKMEVFVGS